MNDKNRATRAYLKCFGKSQINDLLDRVGLTDYEKKIIIMHLSDSKVLWQVSDIDGFKCYPTTVSVRLSRIYTKISNYIENK